MDWVVVPTYNERENIQALIAKIFSISDAAVLIVDDNSPDGTGQLVESLRSRWSQLHVLHRPNKTGLSDAYRAGLEQALQAGAERIVHLDADGSHNPSVIPALLAALESHDLAIGSRYVPGGSLDIPWQRKWISAIGNAYIRWLLGRSIHDWSSGCKSWRRVTLERVLAAPWETKGYACLLVMSWLAKQAGARITEVPIHFVDRTRGASKFSLQIMLEDLRVAWKLRSQPPLEQRR